MKAFWKLLHILSAADPVTSQEMYGWFHEMWKHDSCHGRNRSEMVLKWSECREWWDSQVNLERVSRYPCFSVSLRDPCCPCLKINRPKVPKSGRPCTISERPNWNELKNVWIMGFNQACPRMNTFSRAINYSYSSCSSCSTQLPKVYPKHPQPPTPPAVRVPTCLVPKCGLISKRLVAS